MRHLFILQASALPSAEVAADAMFYSFTTNSKHSQCPSSCSTWDPERSRAEGGQRRRKKSYTYVSHLIASDDINACSPGLLRAVEGAEVATTAVRRCVRTRTGDVTDLAAAVAFLSTRCNTGVAADLCAVARLRLGLATTSVWRKKQTTHQVTLGTTLVAGLGLGFLRAILRDMAFCAACKIAVA